MKCRTVVALTALSLVAFMAAGCANKEVIKSEEPVVKAEKAKVKTLQSAKKQALTESGKTAESTKTVAVQPVNIETAKATFENIYFNFDKSDLGQDARNVLNKNAEILLKEKPSIKIQILGNCDERGSAEYNLALGEHRAKSAQKYLITLGVPADRLSVISYGKEKPAVEGHDETARAKNRRDEFVVML